LMASVYRHCTLLRLTTAERAFEVSRSISHSIVEGFTMPSPVPLSARRALHAACTAVFGRNWWQEIDARIEALSNRVNSHSQPFVGRLVRSTAESALLDGDHCLSSPMLIHAVERLLKSEH
jgi:hypothetical protein